MENQEKNDGEFEGDGMKETHGAVTAPENVAEEKKQLDAEAEEMLSKFIKNESYRDKAKRYLSIVDKKFGISALETSESYTKGCLVEEIIHYMRWEPHYLFDCGIHKLHEYEMALSAHITYVKSKENQWRIICRNANRDLVRAKKLAAGYCDGKSVGEREAMAMSKFKPLKDIENDLDIYNIYMEKCDGISDTLTQMDNSLKKTLENRRFEIDNNNRRKE
jgi:hypothetical protein